MNRELVDCDPEWVATDVEWGAGVSWRCWHHAGCRPRVHFRNPLGGGRPAWGAPFLYQRTGGAFRDLGLEEALRLGECFDGYLVDGTFVERD